jgi:predicted ATPase
LNAPAREPQLTRFAYSLHGATAADLAGALATIQEHHPGQRVWVESVS